MANTRRYVFPALIAAGILWGTTVPLSKLALGWLPPAWLACARFGVAAAVLLAVRKAGVWAAFRPAVLIAGGLGYAGSVVLQNLGIARTSVTHAALIAGSAPMLTAVIAALWHRQVARPVAWAGFALSLAGVGLVAGTGHGGATLRGDGLVMASQLVVAGFTVAQARLLRGRDPVAVTGAQFLAAGLAVLPIALVTESIHAHPAHLGTVAATAGLALCGTVLPFTLFAYAQSHVSADVAGAFVNLEPLVGVIAGAAAFGEPVGAGQAAGATAILAGIALSSHGLGSLTDEAPGGGRERVRADAARGEVAPRAGPDQGGEDGEGDGRDGDRITAQRRQFFGAVAVTVPARQRGPQFARDLAAPAALCRAENRQQQLVGLYAGPAGLASGSAAESRLQQRAGQVDAGQVGVDGLDQAGVDVDERGAVRGDDHVGGEAAVPAERAAQSPGVLADLRQADSPLVARTAACSLMDALACVERDEFAIGEYCLHHDQRPGSGLLDQHAAGGEDPFPFVVIGKLA